MYRIGISGSYGGINIGDEAILHSILDQLRRSVTAEVTVFSRRPADTRTHHAVERAVPLSELSRQEARAELDGLDLFILGGGGILFDGCAELFLGEVAVAHELGIPVLVYAVSAGPLAGGPTRELVREALSGAAVVTVRDRQGRRLLEEVGVQRDIVLTADPALLLQPQPVGADALRTEGVVPGRPVVGFSVRQPGAAAPGIDTEHYHDLVANAADFMVERLDAEIVFVPMERRNDMQHSHAVIARMQAPERAEVLKGEYSPGQLLALMREFDFAVGMRLHFLIFAALQGVPFVALPYAPKVQGLLEDLGMEMPPIDSVSAGQLVARIDRAWDRRQEIRDRLRQALPALQERARETNRIAVRLLRGELEPS